MATTKEQSDLVSHVAYGHRDGSTRITFRYRDGTTKTFEDDATEPVEGEASDAATWWR